MKLQTKRLMAKRMSNANIQQSPALRIEAGSINCILLYVPFYAENSQFIDHSESLPAHYVEYLLLMRLIILIQLIRRTPKTLTDGAGRMMTDTSGASQLTYKPYGEVNRMNSYGPDIFRYKYTSQQDDQDTGLYYYNARYYDPVLGLFTSADNVTNATSSFGLNHYMYTEGNPVRYGDASGNFLIPLLMAAMATAVAAVAVAAVVTVAATIAVTMAVINTVMTASAMAQTAAIATAAFAASAVMAAVRFAIFVDALGVVGAGVGFVAGGFNGNGKWRLEGALDGAEVGFKIGTVVTITAWVVYGAWSIGAVAGPLATGLGIGGTIGTYVVGFTIGGLWGELVKGIGREAGGHLDPGNNGFKYNKKSAYRGQAVADFLNTSSSLASSLWSSTGFLDECSVNETYSHSIDRMGAEIVNTNTIYFTENIFLPIFQNVAEGAVWSEAGKPNPRGSY